MELETKIQELVRKYQLELEDFTDYQLVEVLRQAFLSGDFRKQIIGDKQMIVYLPYWEVSNLLDRIEELETKLEHYAKFDKAVFGIGD
jgi:hypothetical protein